MNKLLFPVLSTSFMMIMGFVIWALFYALGYADVNFILMFTVFSGCIGLTMSILILGENDER